MNTTPAYHLSDKQLVERILHGDTRVFALVVQNTEGLVVQIVSKLIDHTEDRKDIIQEVYLKAFDRLAGFRFQSKLSTWVGQIAYNTSLSWLEKKRPMSVSSLIRVDGSPEAALERLESQLQGRVGGQGATGGSAEHQLRQKELAAILRVEMDDLPPVYRLLVGLYHQEELNYEEMAQIAGLPVGTVKSYLFRARRLLKERLLSKYKKEAL